MSSPAPAVITLKTANSYELASHSGKTNITLNPAHGPLIKDHIQGPTFMYSGSEGKFTFEGSQINIANTPSGTLQSVTLKPQHDAGSITFSLFVPTVSVDAANSQHVTTYGVKAHHRGFVVGPGAQITYEVECLSGNAKAVMVAL